MKVLVVSDSPEIWGAERSLLDLLPALRARGVDCTVLAPRSSPLHALLKKRDFASLEVDLPQHPALQRGGFRAAGLIDLAKELAAITRSAMQIARLARRFDVVLSYSLWRNMDVLLAARLSGRRAVADLHETFEGRFGRALSRLTLLTYDRVVSPSHWAADQACAPKNRVVVTPRITEVPPVLPPRSSRQYTTGMFGQLREHKGHSLLLDALEITMARTTPRVLIVGSGGDVLVSEKIRSFQERFPGVIDWVPRVEDVSSLMQQCASVLNASSHEAFGRTMYEAVIAGAQPVALGAGGPSEVLEELGYGLTLERDTEQLAIALEQIERDGRVPPDPTAALDRLRTSASAHAIGKRYVTALSGGRRE